MKQPTEKTLDFLARTTNEAAVEVLLAGLDSSDADLQEAVLSAILKRRGGAAHGALVDRWDRLSDRWKWRIAEQPRLIAPAVRNAILSADERRCRNGCDALLRIREYELIATLVTTVREAGDSQVALTGPTLVDLANRMSDELNLPPDARQRRDLATVRRQVVSHLARAVEAYEQHSRVEIIEAFLLLCPCDDRVLNMLLTQPRHPAYLPTVDRLRNSDRAGIIRLVLSFVAEPRTPSLILQVVGHRVDRGFLRQWFDMVGTEPGREIRRNLGRIETLRWLSGDLACLSDLTDAELQAAIQVANSSGVSRPSVFRLLQFVLRHGEPGARRLATKALADFGGHEANQLITSQLQDADPRVQAEALVQLRKRSIPGAVGHLIQALSSPHDVVRDAARSCLSEFRFDRYLNKFDLMDAAARRGAGRLVLQVDSSAIASLVTELQSQVRTRRMRALEIVQALEVIRKVEPLVINLSLDEDHFVRAAAVRTLGMSDSAAGHQALQDCLQDRSLTVRESARQVIDEKGNRPTSDDVRPISPIEPTGLLDSSNHPVA